MRPSAADALCSIVGRNRFAGITNSATTSSTTTALPTARLIRTVRAVLNSITFLPEHVSNTCPAHSPPRQSSGSPARTCDAPYHSGAGSSPRAHRASGRAVFVRLPATGASTAISHVSNPGLIALHILRAAIGTSILSNEVEQQENRCRQPRRVESPPISRAWASLPLTNRRARRLIARSPT